MFLRFAGPMITVEQRRPHWAVALKEAFRMTDSFSEGSVFYGRTAAIIAGALALAVLINLI